MTLATPERSDAHAGTRRAVIAPRRAYLELLLIYAVMFGAPAVLSIADFLTSCGLLSTHADNAIYQWGLPLYVRIPAAAWLVAIILVDADLAASAKPTQGGRARWSDRLGRRDRTVIRATMLIVGLSYAADAWNANTLMHGQVLWRWLQLGPVLVLVALALNRRGVTLTAIGLRRRRGPGDAAVARRAFAWSMAGIVASTVLGLLLEKIALHLDPQLLAAYGSGVSTPPLTVNGLARVLLMSLAAGIGEEAILSVLLVIVMTGAGQPRWRWLALAGALRIAFHLYLGIWGFGAVIFAVANAAIFARARRILPLIAAHTLFDILGLLLGHVHLAIALFGINWLQVLLALAVIPIALLADRAVSTLCGGSTARAPQNESRQ